MKPAALTVRVEPAQNGATLDLQAWAREYVKLLLELDAEDAVRSSAA